LRFAASRMARILTRPSSPSDTAIVIPKQAAQTSAALNLTIAAADLLLRLLVDLAREDHKQKLPGAEAETHESPMLKSRGKD